MGKVVVEAIIVIALPSIVFFGGAWLMAAISNRELVMKRLELAAEPDRKPLNERLGYDAAAVKRQWAALDEQALLAEKRFLELDLFFPLLYGSAFAFSLVMARAALGWNVSPVWLLAPVAIGVLADWTENTVLLTQIKPFLINSHGSLQASWVRIASIATTLKLLFLGGASVLVVSLAVIMLVSGRKSP